MTTCKQRTFYKRNFNSELITILCGLLNFFCRSWYYTIFVNDFCTVSLIKHSAIQSIIMTDMQKHLQRHGLLRECQVFLHEYFPRLRCRCNVFLVISYMQSWCSIRCWEFEYPFFILFQKSKQSMLCFFFFFLQFLFYWLLMLESDFHLTIKKKFQYKKCST